MNRITDKAFPGSIFLDYWCTKPIIKPPRLHSNSHLICSTVLFVSLSFSPSLPLSISPSLSSEALAQEGPPLPISPPRSTASSLRPSWLNWQNFEVHSHLEWALTEETSGAANRASLKTGKLRLGFEWVEAGFCYLQIQCWLFFNCILWWYYCLLNISLFILV